MKHNSLILWGVLLLALLAQGCDFRTDDYSEYRRLPKEGWRYSDTLTYRPQHLDSLSEGRFTVAVTHGEDYPYTSVWMEVTSVSGRGVRRDTAVIELTDRFGNWKGQGIAGAYQASDTLPPIVHPSNSPVRVRQIMRADTLRGIQQVGLFFHSR